MKKILFLYLFLVIVVIGLAVIKFTGVSSLIPSFSKSDARTSIKESVFKTEIARSEKEKEIGLSKRKSLDKDTGLLFVFDKKDKHAFWMKDMLFPIDIVYIEKTSSDSITNGVIVDIIENVQAPEKGTPPSSLEIYTPQKEADLVLEINAGISKEKGLAIGDPVTFENVK